MNKSKFLKKSLAMLLALMLVVAMIPLSASAADALPTLEYINVGTTQVKAENNSFSATYPEGATSVAVTAQLPEKTKLEAIHRDNVNSTAIEAASSTLTLSKFAEKEGVYTITLRLSSTDANDGRKPVDYTLVLSPKALSTDASVKSIALATGAADEGLMAVSYDAEKRVVTVTAAYGHTANGKIVVTPVDGATVTNGTAGAATEVTVVDKSTFTVTSAAGETYDWTIKVEEVPALTSLSVAGKAGVFSDSDKDDKNDTITVTLTVDDIKDQYDDIQTSPKLAVAYNVLANTTVSDNATSFASGDKLVFTDLGTNYKATKTINVKNGAKGTAHAYTLNVVIPKSNDTSVSFASIGGIEATLSDSSISAVLEATANIASVDVVIRVPEGATVAPATYTKQADTSSSYDEYKATGVNLSSATTVVVTAADGTASKQYSVSAKKATASSDAVLKTFSAKDPAGNTYTASIDQDKKVITLANVPYMTTGMENWTMFATFSDGAKALYDATTIINGQTPFGANAKGWTDGEDKTLTDTVKVVSLGDNKVSTEYTVKVTFKAANTDKTLKSVEVTAQNKPTSDQALLRGMTKTNTFDATIDSTGKKIKVQTAFSQKDFNKYVTELTTNGGVAFYRDNKALATILMPDKDNTNSTVRSATLDVIVLPEVIAKKYYAEVNATPGTGVDISTSHPDYANDFAKGTQYTFEFTNKDASTEGLLKTLKVGETTLQVGAGSGKITGTIPYGMTISNTELTALTDANKAHYVNFTASDYAALKTTANAIGYTFISGGDKDLDGEADAAPANDNAKLVFVRDAKNTVKVYVFGTAVDNTNALTTLDVYSENAIDKSTDATNEYSLELKYGEPNTGADITSFKLGNTSGSINGTTINVIMPFGTELKALIPTFTLSTGAKANIESGKTVLNCTNDVKITVTSEDGKTSKVYTLKVTVSAQFTDVKPGDWYYKNVMRAVELGILSGKGNGIFAPHENITRRDFAIMLAQSLGHDNSEPATSPFVDVADDDYGVSSIAYLYEQGITAGDNEGKFNPTSKITRQEAATMLAKAFKATGTSTELYADDAKIANWAKSFVYACKDAGLMKGDVAGTFRPNDTFTRAEAASAMVNAVDK